MDHAEWLAARRLGVSGTDISTLLGLNPWKTKHALVLDKLGISKPFGGNILTHVGKVLEPIVAEWYSERNDVVLEPGVFTVSGVDKRFIGTPDFLVVGSKGGLEIKTGGIKTWDNGCPSYYECQCRWYMMITDMDYWDLCTCIVPKDRSEVPLKQGDKFLKEWVRYQPSLQYHFERSQQWESQAQAVALEFLDHLDSLRPDDQGRWTEESGSLPPFG